MQFSLLATPENDFRQLFEDSVASFTKKEGEGSAKQVH